jgi:serine/threonine protein kinase
MRHHSYKSLKTIGRGSFGRVELVENTTDGKCYVMKV